MCQALFQVLGFSGEQDRPKPRPGRDYPYVCIYMYMFSSPIRGLPSSRERQNQNKHNKEVNCIGYQNIISDIE